MSKVPRKLQGILWSVDVGQLDLKENKSYIINQVLSFGTFEELKWLFRSYSKEDISEVFLEQPSKVYSPSAFNFSKSVLLDLDGVEIPPNKYVRTLPRATRS